jgi:glucose/arabinose dehydrogenase
MTVARILLLTNLVACGGGALPRPPTTCPGDSVDAWTSDPGYCLYQFASGLSRPRQMAFAPSGELFVSAGSVTVLFDDDHDGASAAGERATFATAPGLNHGIAFSPDARYLYASSATAVYRWPYQPGARKAAAAAELVVTGIPAGGHTSRTLAFDSQGRLVVSVGSAGNVDTEPELRQTRSQLRRYVVPAVIPPGGLAYLGGDVVASGMRNEAGIYVDARDRIWGVENGRDNLIADRDIHNDNPGEKVNLVDGTGPSFYGYPECFTEYRRPGGGGPGTQWADPSLDPGDRQTDAWCRDPANVHPPAFSLPAHWAPLGVIEYQGTALPLGRDLIVTSHGSWNADPPVGRLLARLRRDGDTITSVEPIFGERGADNGLRQGTWSARPVDVREAADGTLYISDDNGGRVFRLTYAGS